MNALTYRCVDVMKWTKDGVNNQQTDAKIDGILNAIQETYGDSLTHISISVPINANSEFSGGNTPSPRTIENFYLAWTNAIRARGWKVLHRGTLCEIEGIWGFTHAVGANRVAAGTAASAPTDGTATLLGRSYTHLTRLAENGSIQTGDVLAFFPERTEGIFSDATAFLPNTGAGVQTNFANFFNDFKSIQDTIMSNESITGVITGYTANNWSEVNSGWIPASVFSTAGVVSFDHYGESSNNYSPAAMDSNLRSTYAAKGNRVMFHQEWAPYWLSTKVCATDRLNYYVQMYKKFQTLASEGKLNGFNAWSGWVEGTLNGAYLEGILQDLGSNSYRVKAKGKILASFFRGGVTRLPRMNASENY